MRILFMGTPDIARESLEKLYNYGFEICGVVTAPDRPAGRPQRATEPTSHVRRIFCL